MSRIVLAIAALAFAASAAAADLRVTGAWIRWIPGGAPSGGYFTVHNDSSVPIDLLGASSPQYGAVDLHRTVMEGTTSRMEAIDKVTVPAHGELRFKPGSYHLMMMRPGPAVKVGGEATVVLRFSGGRTLDARFPVRGPGG
ncbi:MAG TPA: copper chaperone PCu(A)C [Usitatibacter sp.]|nr:copper chaperone PCu(A)C [Usitatibacter sp.]